MKKAPTETGGGGRGGLFVRAMQTASDHAYASGIPIRLGHLTSFGCAIETPASHMLIWAKSASQFVSAGSVDLLKQYEGICGLRKASCSPSPETSVRWGPSAD